jgi:adenylate cyclase
MSLFAEIRRRNVHRVALAYVAGAWLLIQVVETLFPMFGLSDGAARSVVIVLAIGVVPALIASWVFEWTPHGVVRDGDVSVDTLRTSTRHFDRAITILLVLAVSYFAVDKFVIDPARDAAEIEAATERGRSAAQIESYGVKSIAVLPFLNLSSDPEQEYFSDGITEELLNLLAKIPELRVISRSTAFTFKGQSVDIVEAGKKMDVAHILEGSVRKSGDRIRITAQLIDARTDTHLWSETYDRTLSDIFFIQDEISAHVVSQLKLELLSGPPTAEEINPEAYELYLKGQYLSHTVRKPEAFKEAERVLTQVVDLEPDFVPGIWALARSIANTERANDPQQAPETEARIRELVARMVELAPDSSYANGWLAKFANSDGDWQAEAYYRERAVAGGTDAHLSLQLSFAANLLARIGRTDEALAVLKYVVNRDPACTSCVNQLAFALRTMGRHQEAADQLEKILEWRAPSIGILWHLGVAWLVAGEPARALTYFDDARPGPGELGRLMALHDLGRQDEFELEFTQMIEKESHNPEGIARVYAWTGQNDAAFEWLERMVAQESAGYAAAVKTDLYEPIKSDPRWQVFLEENGVTDEDMSHIEFNPQLPAAVLAELGAQGGG